MKAMPLAIPLVPLLVLASCALCQGQVKDPNREAYGEKCPSLYSADAPTLVKYLSDPRRGRSHGESARAPRPTWMRGNGAGFRMLRQSSNVPFSPK